MENENQETSSQSGENGKHLTEAGLRILWATNEIPERYWDIRLAELSRPTAEIANMLELAQRHCEEIVAGQTPDRGLFFLGTHGTGKTTALAAVAKAALFRCWKKLDNPEPNCVLQPPCGFYKFRDLMARFAAEMRSRNPDDRGQTIHNLCLNSWIFIDDMTVRIAGETAESPYHWAYDAVNHLIDTLWDKGKSAGRLYVTSNNSLSDIAAAFGKPCADRIRGLCEPVQITASSFRGEP